MRQPRRPARRRATSRQAGLQGTGQGGVQLDPLAGQQLGVDRLGQQRVAEHVAVAAAGLGQQQLLVDRLAQPLQQLLVVHAGDRCQQRPGHARAGRGGHAQQLLGAVAQPHQPGQQHLPQAGGQHPRVDALAGQQQLLGKERVPLRAGIDVIQ
jgi:hypothetical protein